jgi:hypothetical protein
VINISVLCKDPKPKQTPDMPVEIALFHAQSQAMRYKGGKAIPDSKTTSDGVTVFAGGFLHDSPSD